MKSAIFVPFLLALLAVIISQSDARTSRSQTGEHWSVDAFPSPIFKHKNLFIRKPSRRTSFDRTQFHQGSSRNSIPYDSVFDRPNFQSHFQSRPLSAYDHHRPQIHHHVPNNQRRQDSGPSDLQEYSQPGSPKQRYLMTLAAKLYQHKQAQNEYSNQLLNSFGTNVAPFNKK